MTDTKLPWRSRAATAAFEIEAKIRQEYPYARPVRNKMGRGIEHALFMATELQVSDGEIDSDTKACRWLGYLQAMLVYEGVSALADEKHRNLATRAAAAE